MSAPINLRQPGRSIRVGIVLMSSVTEHLDIAPAAFFSCISREYLSHAPPHLISDDLKAQALSFEHHWVTEDGTTPARLAGNMKVLPAKSFTNCPPLDIIVLGANASGYQASETEMQFLRKAYASCSALLCVCAGFLPILAAGILDGKTATAPLPMLPTMRQMAPSTNWIKRRWAQDGKIWTSGSLLNGMDMMAAFGRETWGGKDSLVDHMIRVGYWPERDVNYADARPIRASRL